MQSIMYYYRTDASLDFQGEGVFWRRKRFPLWNGEGGGDQLQFCQATQIVKKGKCTPRCTISNLLLHLLEYLTVRP